MTDDDGLYYSEDRKKNSASTDYWHLHEIRKGENSALVQTSDEDGMKKNTMYLAARYDYWKKLEGREFWSYSEISRFQK
jgi:hypothetical protein